MRWSWTQYSEHRGVGIISECGSCEKSMVHEQYAPYLFNYLFRFLSFQMHHIKLLPLPIEPKTERETASRRSEMDSTDSLPAASFE